MKTKKILSAVALVSLLALPVITLAVEEAPKIFNTGDELITKIESISNWIFAILMAVAAVFLIYAGFLYVTSQGNPENITKARLMLINALVGVAIAVLARGLVAVLQSIIKS